MSYTIPTSIGPEVVASLSPTVYQFALYIVNLDVEMIYGLIATLATGYY